MMPMDRIIRELKVTVEGLKRGVTEIALDVNENMQIMKLVLQVSELEKKMKQAFIQLGQLTYQMEGTSRDQLGSSPDVKAHLSVIRDLKRQIVHVEKQVGSLRDEILKDRLNEFVVILRNDGGIIEELVLLSGSAWAGRKVSELALDPPVNLAVLVREDEVIYPVGETILMEGDRIYLIGPRQQVYRAIEASQLQAGTSRLP